MQNAGFTGNKKAVVGKQRLFLQQNGLNVKTEMHYIAIFYDVVFTF